PAESYRITVDHDGAAEPAWPISAGVVLASEVEWLGSAQEVTGAAEVGLQAAAAVEPAAAAVKEPAAAEEPAAEQAEGPDSDAHAEEREIAAVADDAVQAAAASGEPTEDADAGVAAETQREEDRPEAGSGTVSGPLEEDATKAPEETQVGDVPDRVRPASSLNTEGDAIIDSLPCAVDRKSTRLNSS